MKVCVFCNSKGGVGKSSVIFQLGAILSYIGKKVVLVDGDGQNNLSGRLNMSNAKYYLEDLLLDKCNIEHVLQQPYPDDEKLSNIWVIPSSFNLAMIDKEDTDFRNKYTYILSQKLNELDTFDFLLVDTNPAPALLTNMMSYCFADFIIGVLDMSTDSVKGFQSLTEMQLNPIKEVVKPDMKILGLVLNNYDSRSTYSKIYLEQIQEIFGDLLFKSIITSSAIIPQSSASMSPLITFQPSSKLTAQYVELCAEILRRIKQGDENDG